MALQPPPRDVIPEQPIPVARAAFPTGNPDLRRRDALGRLDTNPTFAALLAPTGGPAEAPAQLARITVMQVAEGRSDVQAAAAVRARIDGTDALALDVPDPGVDAAVLSACRQRLLTGHAAPLLGETLLTLWRDQGRLNAPGRQRTDSTHVLAALRPLHRLACVGATRRQALNVLAPAAPAWLRAWVPAGWVGRDRRRCAAYRLPPEKPARYALAEPIGTDGRPGLEALDDPAPPAWLRELPAVQTWRRGWRQQFYATPEGQPMRWRRAADRPPAPLLIRSPDAPEAR
jgi:transposase